jgi:phospholipid transport system transporter-binding protein
MSISYQLPLVVSHENVEEILAAGVKVIEQLSAGSVLTIDCQLLKTFDSSALSVILSLKRVASKRGVIIQLNAIPEKLASLAKVYDLADIVLS